MRVAVVQQASGLEPDGQPGPPRRADPATTPTSWSSRRRSPATSARPAPTSAAFAEAVDGPFARAVERVAAERRTDRGGRHVRDQPTTRPGPSTRWWCAARRRPTTARSTSTTRSATASPTGSRAGADRAARWSRSAGSRVGLMTCYDLRFPELARAWSPRAPRCSSSRRRGSPGRGRSTTGGRCCAPGRSRTPCTSSPPAQPAPRYTGHSMVVDPLGDVLAEAGDGRRDRSRATLDPEVLAEARRTNPSLANRRL